MTIGQFSGRSRKSLEANNKRKLNQILNIMRQIRFYIFVWFFGGVIIINCMSCQLRENVTKTNRTSVEQHYMYRPANGGIEIHNGNGRFNQPLYTSVERPYRIVALASDRPDFMLIELLGKGSLFKLANLKLGFIGEPWLSEIEPVTARYELGTQKYQIGEGVNTVFLDAVRALDFDGLIVRIFRSGADGAPLVLALGGRASGSDFGSHGSNLESNSSAARLSPEDCQGTTLTFSDNVLTLSGEGEKERVPVHATSSVPLKFKAGDPAVIESDPAGLLASQSDTASVAVLTADWPQSGEIFFILTSDNPNSVAVKDFRTDPKKVFTQAVQDNRAIANTIQIDTPDPYLNATLPAALLGYNGTWNEPVFCHGAVSWHTQCAGWRVTYGGTAAGWHDRVQSHMNAFYGKQHADGRIPSLLENDEIYNMGEVFVDQALHDWEWTGDLEPLRDGGFDAIARHLAWGETYVKTDEGLYENFLNAWNTDYKWCNGGGGTIASVYYWRANKTMADIAIRLGKNATVFQKRATEIAQAMKKHLWSEQAGVYGEYRDRFGHQMLHESPDLSSIYTPIDAGFTNPFESYRMLRFALRRFEVIDGLPRDGKLIYSSEILPNHYSSRGIYTAEIMHMNLALYLIGQSETAEPFRRAIDGSFFSGPGPGSTGLFLNPDGTYVPPIDFSDPMSLYGRNVVGGLFGVKMDAPNKRIILQPSFPLAWEYASIKSPSVSYEYTRDGRSETLSIETPRQLTPTIRLRARYASIKKVTINGKPVEYLVEPGIGYAWIVITAPISKETQVEVVYNKEVLPTVESQSSGLPGESVLLTATRGRFTKFRDSSSGLGNPKISADTKQFSAQLPTQSGVYTYFVQVERDDVRFWVPIEVDVQAAEENAPVSDIKLIAIPVKLNKFHNQRLADLHKNSYGPRVEEPYWVLNKNFCGITEGVRTVQANGRTWWEGHEHRNDLSKFTDTYRLEVANGQFVSDNGIPFAIPATGKDAVFTSLYDNFPDSVRIPVKTRGRKICFLVAASISTAQSRMENARITAVLGDGTRRTLSLRDPENIDDWLGSGTGIPYVQSGRVQSLGKYTHAVLQEIELGDEKEIQSVILETRTNETMVGLLGMTVMTE